MPKIVDKDLKKLEISGKAMKIFARKGFEKTTIQEIADGAGIGKGTIYEYFKTKEDIIAQAILSFFAEMEKAFSSDLMNMEDPREKLRHFIIGSVDTGLMDDDIWIVFTEIWYYNMRGGYRSIHKLFNNFLNQYRTLLTEIIDEGVVKGLYREDIDSASIASAIGGFMDGIGLHYLLDKESIDIRKIAESYLNVLLRGIEK
jgi:AcrR family transcriptional regulator